MTYIMLVHGYEQITEGYDPKSTHVNINAPLLTLEDISDLILYVSKCDNLFFMEAMLPRKPEPIARLYDSVGITVGGANMVSSRQVYCGSSYFCRGNVQPNLHAQFTQGVVVYERYDGTSKITINDDYSTSWSGPVDMPTLNISRFKDKNDEGTGRYTFFG